MHLSGDSPSLSREAEGHGSEPERDLDLEREGRRRVWRRGGGLPTRDLERELGLDRGGFVVRGADPRAAWGTIKKRVRCLVEGSSYQLLAISF